MALIIPNSIDNDTAADAEEIQHNFNTIQAYVNTNLVNRDGSVELTAPLLLPGDPTQPNHAANKGYVDGADALKVNKAGDTMTGNLTFAAAMGLLLPNAGSTLGFGSLAGQHINLYGTTYGIGIQTSSMYFRVSGGGVFRFYHGGEHSDVEGNAGTGGVGNVAITSTAVLLPDTQSTLGTAAVHKTYADTKVATAGDTMTGPLLLPATQSTNVNAAVHKTYADTKVDLDGDTMTGQLNVGAIPSAAVGRDGLSLRTDGAIQSLVTTGAAPNSLPNMVLGRQGTQPQATGGTFIRFERLSSGADAGSITIDSGGGVNYNVTSDYRVKDDLGPIDDPVDRLLQLQPKHLRMKSNGAVFDGFIAHEVAEVVPNAVTGVKDADTMQQFDAGKLIPLLVATVQQLAARVAELELPEMTVDSGYYESLRRGVESEFAAGMAGNTYSQTLARNRGNRDLDLMKSTFKRGVPGFSSGFAARGMGGGGVKSGVMQRSMSNYLGDFQRDYSTAETDLADQLRGYDLTAAQMGSRRTSALADIEMQRAREIAFAAQNIEALRAAFGGL